MERIESAHGLDAAADQYPPRRRDDASTIPASSILAPSSPTPRRRSDEDCATIRDLMLHGVSGWENVSLDPGWAGS